MSGHSDFFISAELFNDNQLRGIIRRRLIPLTKTIPIPIIQALYGKKPMQKQNCRIYFEKTWPMFGLECVSKPFHTRARIFLTNWIGEENINETEKICID